MRIPDKIESAGLALKHIERTRERAVSGNSEVVAGKDQVTVSEKAKEIGKLQTEVGNIPEIRADRVEQVKKAYSSGVYNVKGEAVAAKILKEAVIDSKV